MTQNQNAMNRNNEALSYHQDVLSNNHTPTEFMMPRVTNNAVMSNNHDAIFSNHDAVSLVIMQQVKL